MVRMIGGGMMLRARQLEGLDLFHLSDTGSDSGVQTLYPYLSQDFFTLRPLVQGVESGPSGRAGDSNLRR